eukprot:PhM_4_TR8376/c0_g1_i1/m.65994
MAALLERKASAVLERHDNLLDVVGDGALLRNQLHARRDDPAARHIGQVRTLEDVAQTVDHHLWGDLVTKEAVLADNPRADLVHGIGLLRRRPEDAVELLDTIRPEECIFRLVLTIALRDELEHALKGFLLEVRGTKLEHARHAVDVPRVRRGELVDDVAEVVHHLGAEVCVACDLEVLREAVDNHLHVAGVRHGVEQTERLAADGVIDVLEAVNNDVLVGRGVAWVDRDDVREGCDAEILEVRACGCQELAHMLGGRFEELRVGHNACRGADGLVDDGVADVKPSVCALEHLGKDVVHLLAGVLITSTDERENAQHLDLDPRCWDAVVVVVARQAVLRDLLENGNQRWHEVPLRGWVDACHIMDEH